MDRTTWIKAQEVFHQVAELSPENQPRALESLCPNDPELIAIVRSMLDEDRRASSLEGDASLASLAQSLADDGSPLWPPVEHLGPYRIERLLGEGGMGVVYLARRTDTGNLVAIKLLRDAWVSPARRRRFILEQRTLAQLNHPGIAQLFDADTLPDGTPWFVMEYVDGLPLTAYWDARKGPVQRCIQLFREVCEAVLYAHRRAIIHRDLKPSNILVTSDGRAKLLDFGIAKHLDDSEIKPDATLTGLRPMTPAYAAPEQYAGAQVGVFTDVYALGVILYELLSGALPFNDLALARNERGDALKPSTRATPGRFSAPITRDEWADLNVLCLTAMRSEPERRYPSVEAMIRDLDAFLEGRPLEARAEHLFYRLRKYVVRHRLRLAYVAVTLLLVTGLVTYFTLRLSRARDQALAEAARTQRIQQFTSNLFRGNEASVGPSADLRVKTLLDRGREQAEGLASDPDMQADMRETLGDIYRKLGDAAQADHLLSASLERRRQQQSLSPARYAQNLSELALARMDQAKLEEAEGLARQAVEISHALRPVANSEAAATHANAMLTLGTVLEAKGDYAEAVSVLDSALKLLPSTPDTAIARATTLRELANAHFYQAHYDVAASLNRNVLALHRSLYGEKHAEVAEDLNNLAAVQLELGNLSEAETQYSQSLAITEAWYGPQHPKTAEDLTSLGRTLVREKKYSIAAPLLARALAIQQTIHGQNHPAVASALNELGNMESLEANYAQAEAHFSQALEIWRKVYGRDHQFIGVGLSNLGSVYMGEKNFPKAEQMYRQALQVFVRTVHEDHPNTGIAHLKLGRSLLRQKRFREAEPETLTGYQTLKRHVDPTNNFLKAARLDLTQIYIGLNRKQEADLYRVE